MKILLGFIILLSIFILPGCSQKNNITPNIKNNTNINKLIEQTIEEKENCNRGIDNEKMFVAYTILGTGTNKMGNIEYYLVVSGEGMYLDKRGNISSSCGFSGIPTKLEIQQTQTGFSLIDYQTALDGNLYVSSTKKLFSSEAFKKRQKKDYNYNTDLSPLQRAEKYFKKPFWTGGNFKCSFCNQKRYYAGSGDEEKVKKGTQESYSIFTNNENEENRYLIFNKDGTFENHNSRDAGTGTWIFGKDNTTILVNAYPYHTYDRYIIQYQTGNEIHLTREILQK